MIGYDLLTNPGWTSNYIAAYQYDGIVYATFGYIWNSGFDFKKYDSYANIIYI